MRSTSRNVGRTVLFLLACVAHALWAPTPLTCNGLPATIVATAPGQIIARLAMMSSELPA